MTAYKITYQQADGRTYTRITDMAAGITLQQARDYFLHHTFTDENPETGQESRRVCIAVEPYESR